MHSIQQACRLASSRPLNADAALAFLLGTFCVGIVLATVAAGATAAPSSSPASTSDAINRVLAELVVEAENLALRQTPPTLLPDFARRCRTRPAQADIVAALASRQHPDPFVDAYVRWQLTSFEPPLPAWSDGDFFSLMSSAPAMIANPRADAGLIELLALAEGSTNLETAVVDRLRTLMEDLDQRELMAEQMNRPALAWRDWIARHLEKEGVRPRQWLAERCSAMLKAGWPVRSLKLDMTRSLAAASEDPAITYSQRIVLTEQLEQLRGRERRLVTRVIFSPDGAIIGRYARTGVSDEELDEWQRLLGGEAAKIAATAR
jgi:hypothetical protein